MPVTAGEVLVQTLNGISIGLSLALIAVSLTLIFGVMDIVNFAHGEFYMLGAYGTIVIIGFVGNYWVGLVIAAVLVAIFGAVVEWITLRPIRDRDPLQSLIVTFGFVLVFQQTILEIFGGSPKNMPTPITGTLTFAGITYPWNRIAAMVGALVIIGGLFLFLSRTRLGIMMRASSQDLDAARTLGVPADRVFSISFALSVGLAALAAGFLAPIRGVSPTMGTGVILDAFIVVIVGGLGSVFGAVVAALLIGLTQSLSIIVLPSYMSQIIALLLLIIVLLVKPEGLFGE
jgi:branched-chain amino acid transport system permease protein